VPEHRPRRGQRPGRLRTLHGRVDHRIARPARVRIPGVPAQLGLREQQHRGALRRVAVLVQVDRQRAGSRHGQVERRRVGQEGQHPAADAGVHVAAHAALGRGRGDRRHRVDGAGRVRRGGGHDEHGPVGDRVGQRVDQRPEVRVDRCRHDGQPEVVRRLVERRMRGHRQHSSAPSTSDRASLAAFTASRQDSVPPEVNVPTPPPSTEATVPTTECERAGLPPAGPGLVATSRQGALPNQPVRPVAPGVSGRARSGRPPPACGS
jgi:hypothetical protein